MEPLEDSLTKYRRHLREQLRNKETRKRFRKLQQRSELGCFCKPGDRCHVDIILRALKKACPGKSLPVRRSVKVSELRKVGYTSLEDWMEKKGNEYCGRRGRVWIYETGSKRIFHYKQSEWHNPFKVKK